MKNFQEIHLGVIGILLFIIGIILGVLFSGDNSEELMKISKEKEALESRVASQTSTISELNNGIEEAEKDIKKNQTVSKELSELEKFKPLGSEKTVKQLYEEEQARIKAEQERQEKELSTLKFEVEIENKGQAEILFNTITNLPNAAVMDLYLFSEAKMDTFTDIIDDIDYSRWYNASLLNVGAGKEELQKVMNQQGDWGFDYKITPNKEYSFLLYHPKARPLTLEEEKNKKRLVWIDYLKAHNKAKEFFESERNLKFMFEIGEYYLDEDSNKLKNPGYSNIKYLPENCERYNDKYNSKSIRCEFMMN